MSRVILTFNGKGEGRDEEPFYPAAVGALYFPHANTECEVTEGLLQTAGVDLSPEEYCESIAGETGMYNRGRAEPWLSYRVEDTPDVPVDDPPPGDTPTPKGKDKPSTATKDSPPPEDDPSTSVPSGDNAAPSSPSGSSEPAL